MTIGRASQTLIFCDETVNDPLGVTQGGCTLHLVKHTGSTITLSEYKSFIEGVQLRVAGTIKNKLRTNTSCATASINQKGRDRYLVVYNIMASLISTVDP